MDSRNDLQLVLRAVQDGVLSPMVLAEVGGDWDPGREPSFLAYLVGRGFLSPDQLQHLESSLKSTGRPGSNGETFASPAAGGGGPAKAAGTLALSGPDSFAETREGHFPGDAPPPQLPAERYGTPKPFRRGGLGQVWTVLDKTVGREVALKSLRPDLKSRSMNYARFTREARITGQLEHPGVVPLYDVLRDGPRLAYTMRFVDGRTLAEATADYHAKRKAGTATALDFAGLVDAFLHVCRAVAFAHSRGILHRDLKGQNVVLGDFGEVFLLDWGLGKHVDEREPNADPETSEFHTGDTDEQTATGAVVGTPGFMAPEIAAGEPATKAADVYGLGAILYTILAGDPPFKGGSPAAILKRVQNEAPKPPRAVNPAAPPALEAVALRAMARNAEGRYPGADALAADVRRWLADEPVSAYRDAFSVRAVRWAKRHRTGVVAAAVLGLATVAGLSAGSFLLWKEKERTREQKELAEKNFSVAERNFDLAYKASNGGFEVVEYAEPYLASKQELMAARKDALVSGSTAFREFLAQKPDDAVLRLRAAALFRMTANVHRFDGEFAQADALYTEAVGLLEKLGADDANTSRLSQVLRDYAQSLVFRGKLKEALATDDRAKSLADALLKANPDDPGRQRLMALTELDRAGILSAMGKGPEAETAATRAVEFFKNLVDRKYGDGTHPYDPLMYGSALTRLAVEKRDSKKVEEARKLHFDAVGQFQFLLGKIKLAESKPGDPERKVEEIDVRRFEGVNSVDVLHLVSRARLEQVRTKMQIPTATGVEGQLESLANQWAALSTKYPKSLTYRTSHCSAHLARGNWLAEQARIFAERKDTARSELLAKGAAQEFEKAKTLAAKLASDFPDLASARADLGRALFGLAKVQGGAEDRLSGSVALRKAVEMAPDHAEYRSELTELLAGQ